MSSSSPHIHEAEPVNNALDSEVDRDVPNAETPLLRGYTEPREKPASSAPVHRHYAWTIALSLCAVFLIEIGDSMQKAPMTRAFEDILCRKYYESATPTGTHITLPIPEEDCKIPIVQGQLAMLKGWDAAFACIPGLLLAFPYGYIADRYERKIVLVLSLVGVTLGVVWLQLIVRLDTALDVRWLWAGNVFLCIGGGSVVFNATIYAMFADVTPENRRAAVFFQLLAAAMLSPLVGVPAAWYLMKTSPLLAMELGLIFICCGLFLIFFLPETLDRTKLSTLGSQIIGSNESPDDDSLWRSFKMGSILGAIQDSTSVLTIPAVRMLLITFVTWPVTTRSSLFLVQYASDKYHWSIADASLLTPFSAITTFVVLVVILPVIYSLLGSRLGLHTAMRDVVVARGSLIFMVLGSLAIGLAPTPGLFIVGTGITSFGAGYVSAIRSLVTSFLPADQVSRLYGIIAVIETVGNLVSNPLISKAFSWGMDLGGIWSGMSFIVAGLITLVLGIPVYIIPSPKPEEDIHG
ncbi:hypothetical protein B7463_g8215, partial [Scytalidium lignicola]